ncbi:MAG: hypothetical protein GY822_00915, partial [Deltaproteobacteria bacterium]|nr:hypothetical protein [Deltaproteobacteria bacterium]
VSYACQFLKTADKWNDSSLKGGERAFKNDPKHVVVLSSIKVKVLDYTVNDGDDSCVSLEEGIKQHKKRAQLRFDNNGNPEIKKEAKRDVKRYKKILKK